MAASKKEDERRGQQNENPDAWLQFANVFFLISRLFFGTVDLLHRRQLKQAIS
jgi:hypothetical protein